MSTFSQTLCLDNRQLTLHFQEIKLLYGSRYFITIEEGKQCIAAFDMNSEETETWKICPPVADWVLQLEQALSQFITVYRKRKVQQS